MQTQMSMVIHDKDAPNFSNFIYRIKCLFGKHQMLPVGEVRMYGQRSFVIECPHCALSRWGSWPQRLDFGSYSDWQLRGGRVRKSVLGKEIKFKKEKYGTRAIKKLGGKVDQGSGRAVEVS